MLRSSALNDRAHPGASRRRSSSDVRKANESLLFIASVDEVDDGGAPMPPVADVAPVVASEVSGAEICI